MSDFDDIFRKAHSAAAPAPAGATGPKPATVPGNLERYLDLCPKYARKGKTKAQKAALGYYTFCLNEEDRYTGSVFYRPGDKRSQELEQKSKDASDYCKMVGIENP